jgi:Putative lumazine-binding
VTARIPAVLALVLVLVPALAACGRSEEREVRETLEAFAQATARKDYQRLCDDLFAQQLVEEVRRTVPCEVALQNSSLDDARDPKLTIRSIRVDGDQATALVATSAANQRASEDRVRLVKEGESWRIVALAS